MPKKSFNDGIILLLGLMAIAFFLNALAVNYQMKDLAQAVNQLSNRTQVAETTQPSVVAPETAPATPVEVTKTEVQAASSTSVAPPKLVITALNIHAQPWKTYTNKQVGFSFQYPASVPIDTDHKYEEGGQAPALYPAGGGEPRNDALISFGPLPDAVTSTWPFLNYLNTSVDFHTSTNFKVFFTSSSDPLVQDCISSSAGGLADGPYFSSHVVISGISYCHYQTESAYTGGFNRSETYSTKLGNEYLVFDFEQAGVNEPCRVVENIAGDDMDLGDQLYQECHQAIANRIVTNPNVEVLKTVKILK